MERLTIEPRAGWQGIVTELGLPFHMNGDRPYWDESAFYFFTADEIDALEKATYALNEMCLAAVEYVLEKDLWEKFQIARRWVPWIKESWEHDERTIYGRFDFAFDGHQIKLLEYNADTPTCLIEAAVVQWHWFKSIAGQNPALDQFNSIHERLIEAWAAVKTEWSNETMYFTSIPDYDSGGEDFLTANYLRDTAAQAGLRTEYIEIGQVGYHSLRGYTDLFEKPIRHFFKLYPWEWLLREPFGQHLMKARTRWLEAPWKMILSNKAILPVLHQLYPDSPYILPADFTPLASNAYVAKPVLGREGANTRIIVNGETIAERGGEYTGTCIYQEYFPLPSFGNGYPIIGSWLVNGYAAGIGIREDDSRITGNQCRFIPHLFDTRSVR